MRHAFLAMLICFILTAGTIKAAELTPTVSPVHAAQAACEGGEDPAEVASDTSCHEALAEQPCPRSAHDAITVVGPNGKRYPTWHTAVDPLTGCYFGHEHGADPHTSAANASPPPFGYVADMAGHDPEPHEGFKVFVVHRSTVSDEGKPSPADIRVVFHMGTSRVGRYSNPHHSMMFDYVAPGGRIARVQGMADTGAAVGSTCDNPRRGGRDFSTLNCDDPYEIWSYQLQIVHPRDPHTGAGENRFTAQGGVAAFDPVTTRDPSDQSRLVYTQEYRRPGLTLDPLSNEAFYRGCRRELYAQPSWANETWRAQAGTVYWTDGQGRIDPKGEGPNLLRQEISVGPKSSITAYKYRQDFCEAAVWAPN